MTSQHLTTGNTAKLYCVNWMAQKIALQPDETWTILDLGGGTGNNFVQLMARFPGVHYTSIEPSPSACEVARRTLPAERSTIIQDYAYDIQGRLVTGTFDFVTSFSVMEHVYQRLRYLQSAHACMHDESYLLMNYDAGHFVRPGSLKERLKNIIGPLLANVGIERYYQRFVREADFQAIVRHANLRIVDDKFFNTMLKGIHKEVPADLADEHQKRWLDYELWLNDTGITYRDEVARYWVTRNFIMQTI